MPVYKDERRGTYFYSFSYQGKRVRSKDFANRKDCDKALAKALLETDKIPSETYTFNQVAHFFFEEQAKKLKPQSLKKCQDNLTLMLSLLGNVRVDKLSVTQYQKALKQMDKYEYRGKPLTNAYKNKLLKTFKQLCKFSEKRYDLATNVPWKFDNYKNDSKEEMRIITPEEFSRFYEQIEEPCYRALFTVLFFMGFRLGEANALQWSDVDFEKNTISVNKAVTTKMQIDGEYLISTPKTASSVRTLPMPQIVSRRLLEYRDNLPIKKENLAHAFLFGLSRPIPESNIRVREKKWLQMAELPDIRIHDFRHSCASYLINKNATPLLVSKWLGHSSVTMTLNVYSHLWKSELEQIVDVINADF